MVDNAGDRVTLPEKVMIPKKRIVAFLAVTGNATLDQYE